MPRIEEIVAGPQDKPSYDFKFYADGFKEYYILERRKLQEYPCGSLCSKKSSDGQVCLYHAVWSHGRRQYVPLSSSDKELIEKLKRKQYVKQGIKWEYESYRLALKLLRVPVPEYIRESELQWNVKRRNKRGGYYIGMIEEEYERSKGNYRHYKDLIIGLSKSVQLEYCDCSPRYNYNIEQRERLMGWCRRLLKSIYVFEKGLKEEL